MLCKMISYGEEKSANLTCINFERQISSKDRFSDIVLYLVTDI
jgi:hypothetical protein